MRNGGRGGNYLYSRFTRVARLCDITQPYSRITRVSNFFLYYFILCFAARINADAMIHRFSFGDFDIPPPPPPSARDRRGSLRGRPLAGVHFNYILLSFVYFFLSFTCCRDSSFRPYHSSIRERYSDNTEAAYLTRLSCTTNFARDHNEYISTLK